MFKGTSVQCVINYTASDTSRVVSQWLRPHGPSCSGYCWPFQKRSTSEGSDAGSTAGWSLIARHCPTGGGWVHTADRQGLFLSLSWLRFEGLELSHGVSGRCLWFTSSPPLWMLLMAAVLHRVIGMHFWVLWGCIRVLWNGAALEAGIWKPAWPRLGNWEACAPAWITLLA